MLWICTHIIPEAKIFCTCPCRKCLNKLLSYHFHPSGDDKVLSFVDTLKQLRSQGHTERFHQSIRSRNKSRWKWLSVWEKRQVPRETHTSSTFEPANVSSVGESGVYAGVWDQEANEWGYSPIWLATSQSESVWNVMQVHPASLWNTAPFAILNISVYIYCTCMGVFSQVESVELKLVVKLVALNRPDVERKDGDVRKEKDRHRIFVEICCLKNCRHNSPPNLN